MAKTRGVQGDWQVFNINTVNGANEVASTTVDYDVFMFPKPIKNYAMQVSIVTSAVSNSLVSLGVKLLGGMDENNWMSLLYFSVSDTTNASTSIYKWVWSTPVKFIKMSVKACSYDGEASDGGTASFNALFMPIDFV
jgi:hypothetical protein